MSSWWRILPVCLPAHSSPEPAPFPGVFCSSGRRRVDYSCVDLPDKHMILFSLIWNTSWYLECTVLFSFQRLLQTLQERRASWHVSFSHLGPPVSADATRQPLCLESKSPGHNLMFISRLKQTLSGLTPQDSSHPFRTTEFFSLQRRSLKALLRCVGSDQTVFALSGYITAASSYCPLFPLQFMNCLNTSRVLPGSTCHIPLYSRD